MIRFNCPHCQRAYQLPAALAGLPLVCKGCNQRFVPAAQPAAPPAPPPPAPKIERAIAPPAPKPVPPAPKPEPPKPVAPSAADTARAPGDDVFVTKADSTPEIDFNVGGPTAASLSDAARQRPKGLSSANMPPPTDSDTDRDSASVPELDLDALARARTEPELNVPPKPPAPPARTESELVLPVPPPPKALPNRAPRRVHTPAVPPPVAEPEPEPEPAARSGLIPFAADLFALVVLLVVGMLLGEFLVQKHTGAVLANVAQSPIDALLWAAAPLVLALVYVLLAGRGASFGALLRRR